MGGAVVALPTYRLNENHFLIQSLYQSLTRENLLKPIRFFGIGTG